MTALALAALSSCIHQELPSPPPSSVPAESRAPEPLIRVGLEVGASGEAVGGGAALVASAPDGSRLAAIAAGEAWRVIPAGPGVALVSPLRAATPPIAAITIAPADSNGLVRIGRKEFRGTVMVARDRTGITLINLVPIEAYIAGVVGSEMGRRDSSEIEAVRAQAVISRTYALRNMGRWRSQGFDFYATVSDQVYGGVTAENALGRQAVSETRGEIVTYGGRPIDAFFFSTCGGRTADGTEAFRGATRSYLKSISDVDPSGVAYCSASPRFRWRDEWDGEALRSMLTRTLRENNVTTSARLGRITSIRAAGRTGSGRVAGVAVSTTAAGELIVDAPRVRNVFRIANGDILRSTAIQLTASYKGGQVSRLVIDGMGTGHGVGMCQWGAVGRARAGQRYPEILSAYFQGTELRRAY